MGKTFRLEFDGNGMAELVFDLQDDVANKFSRAALAELEQVLEKLQQDTSVKGLLVSSGKDNFSVGMDVSEFPEVLSLDEKDIESAVIASQGLFNALEDLPFPTVSAVNGIAFGGGFEFCLATDYRVLSADARVGLPETKLGLCPGWGGTVRLPRVAGLDNAIEWICAGKELDAELALKSGVADAVVAREQLKPAALKLLGECARGAIDYRAKRKEKLLPVKLNQVESRMTFATAGAVVRGQAGPHYPAPPAVVKALSESAALARDEALQVEAACFARLAGTEQSANLVNLFLNDQYIDRKARSISKKAKPAAQAAVLGAGIMGGGIAYQSALKGIPILMKDINSAGLELGLSEASKQLARRVKRGRMSNTGMAQALNNIVPVMSYGDFGNVDIVVEAVVENPGIKQSVLSECESHIADDAVLTSNTSTIPITLLAGKLQRPQNFCGMHFFNPVHRMPLVEVIRGRETGEDTIARVVAYVRAIGKKAVVVNDCAGFFVNRVLVPYMIGFNLLLRDGADFAKVDKVMESFGWPMGPAWLSDVVGIDTGVHVGEVMAEAYPDRMASESKGAGEVLHEAGRLGQKNGKGYYAYETDRKGNPKKVRDPESSELIKAVAPGTADFDRQEIIDRMMIPMCIETARCLDEKIIGSVNEADMAVILGLGFPPFLGGLFRYMDAVGPDKFCELADGYAGLGPLYAPTDSMRSLAGDGKTFYQGT